MLFLRLVRDIVMGLDVVSESSGRIAERLATFIHTFVRSGSSAILEKMGKSKRESRERTY